MEIKIKHASAELDLKLKQAQARLARAHRGDTSEKAAELVAARNDYARLRAEVLINAGNELLASIDNGHES